MKLSHKNRLFLIICGSILLYMAFTVLFVELHLKRVVDSESVDNGKELSALLAANITDDFLIRNYAAIDSFFENTLKSNPKISYIFIEKDGTPSVHTFSGGFPRGLLNLGHRKDVVDYLIVEANGKKYFDFSAPIMGGKEGLLRVGITHESLESALNRSLTLFIILGVILAVVSSFFSLMITRKIFAPLTTLTNAAHEISEGDYAKNIPILDNGDLEVEELSRAFDKMVKAIRMREQELRDTNEQLETYGVRMYEYIEELNKTKDELVRAKQDAAVVDTSRAFLHHVRQPLTYLTMAIEMLTDEVTELSSLNKESVYIKLRAIDDAGKRLAEMLRKFEQLRAYKTVSYSDTTRIVDIEE